MPNQLYSCVQSYEYCTLVAGTYVGQYSCTAVRSYHVLAYSTQTVHCTASAHKVGALDE
jgi:hypothetical protein